MKNAFGLILCLSLALESPAAEKASPPIPPELLRRIEAYRYGADRSALEQVERMVQEALGKPRKRAALAAALASALAGEAPYDAKQFICRQLARIGGEDQIPALAALLPDPKLSHMALYALARIPSPRAAAAIRAALPKAAGRARLGLINALGDLRDPQAVPALIRLLDNPDAATAQAAAAALGAIGTAEAATALSKRLERAEPSAQGPLIEALAAAAARLPKASRGAATAALRKALSGNGPAPARAKALAALVEADPETAFPFVVQSLQAEARPLRRAAAFLLRRYPAAQIVKALEPKWSAFTPAARRWICAALRDLGDPAGRSLILKELAAAAPADRAPAIAALGATGGAEDVATLLRKAASGSPEEQQAARTALDRMRAPGVEAELSRAARGADESVAAEAILALGRRGAADAAPLLLQIARTGPAAAREPALKALRAVARPEDLPELIELTETVPEESFDAALDTLHAAALRWNRASETARRLSAAFRAAAPQARRERLLRTLARFGGPEALAALREALRSPLQATALRLLAGWPDAEPLPDVRAALASADTPALHTLAMRAYLRLADRDESADAAERLARCRFAWSRARSAEERRLVLAGAGRCLTPDALSWAAQALEDEAVRPEAQAALLQLCVGLRGADPDACAAILRRIAAAPASEQFGAQAGQILEAIAASRGWLCAWQASPPYAQPGKSCAELFDIAFAPETAPQNTPWRILPPSPTPGQPWLMDLLALYPQEQAVAYARTHLWLPAEREAILHLGTDDGFKLWVNGRLVAKHNVMRAVQPDQEKIPIRLRQGWNDLLLKVTQNNQGWGFCARLTGPDGAPLSDGRAAAELP